MPDIEKVIAVKKLDEHASRLAAIAISDTAEDKAEILSTAAQIRTLAFNTMHIDLRQAQKECALIKQHIDCLIHIQEREGTLP